MSLLVLVLAIGVSALGLWRDGTLETTQHPDTPSYLKSVDSTELTQILAHYRTYGYPLFLKSLGWLRLGWPALPYVQLTLYFGAVLLFFAAVRSYGGSAWLALCAALPLACAEILRLAGWIQPDFLSAALALVAFSAMLMLTVRPRHVGLWATLTMAVFAAYQVRPATVFLIAWIPLAGWFLRGLREPGSVRRIVPWAALLATVTFLPYLGFATLRLAAVGHFGLVSFGGYNLSALSACFLDRELVDSLQDSEQHALARAILNRRERRGWRPMTLDDRGATVTWFRQYNDNLWRLSLPAAWTQLRRQRRSLHRLREAGETVESDTLLDVERTPPRVLVNRRLTDFSHSVLRRRPLLYLVWVKSAVVYGLARLPGSPWIRWPTIVLLVSVVTTGLGRVAGRALGRWALGRWAPGRWGPGGWSPGGWSPGRWGPPPQHRAAVGLGLAGLSYAALYLLLTSLVSFPFERYYLSIALFVPSSLCLFVYALWVRLLARRTTRELDSAYQD